MFSISSYLKWELLLQTVRGGVISGALLGARMHRGADSGRAYSVGLMCCNAGCAPALDEGMVLQLPAASQQVSGSWETSPAAFCSGMCRTLPGHSGRQVVCAGAHVGREASRQQDPALGVLQAQLQDAPCLASLISPIRSYLPLVAFMGQFCCSNIFLGASVYILLYFSVGFISKYSH